MIHIADPSKFLDQALGLFEEVLPGRNRVFLRQRVNDFEISSVTAEHVFYESENAEAYESELEKSCLEACGVVVHFLNSEYKRKLILRLPADLSVVWFSWGPDLWVVPNMYRKLYAPLTYRMLIPKYHHLRKILYSIRDLFNKSNFINELTFFCGHREKVSIAFNAIKRTNYIATVIPDEYERLRRSFDYKGEYVKWNYQSCLNLLTTDVVTGNKVLVGHSSHAINNHFDCFDALMRKEITQDVVIPCSYGDYDYRARLITVGKALFGPRFQPITDFMSFKDYAQMLQSCSAAIMGQYCQQGLGTAIILLWNGTKLFLSNRNPMFSFFISNQLKCFSIEKDLNSARLDVPLRMDEIAQNRDILQRLYGHEQLLANTKSLCDMLESYRHG